MYKKRWAAGLLSFILLMNTGVNALAAGAVGGSTPPSVPVFVEQEKESKTVAAKAEGSQEDSEKNEKSFSQWLQTGLEEKQTEIKDNQSSSVEEEGEKSSIELGKEKSEELSAELEEESSNESEEDDSENTSSETEVEEEKETSTEPGEEESEESTKPEEEETEESAADLEEETEESETESEEELLEEPQTAELLNNQTVLQEGGNITEYQDALTADAKVELQDIIDSKAVYALVYLTDVYEVKAEASKTSQTISTLASAHTVQILGAEVVWEYMEEWEEYIPTVWYQVQFYVGENLQTGYIEESYLAYSDELLTQWKDTYYELFPLENRNIFGETIIDFSDVKQFPTSYQVYLKKLKEQHPNWTFVPMKVNRDWNACVKEQQGDYSWIYYNQPAEYRAGKINSSWYYASIEGISYYMDPRNFLTERNIFQFEQNTYNASYHTLAALQSFLSNTFMKGAIPGDAQGRSYASVIWNSGKVRGLSPFNLAARVIQEQGSDGSSAMISGTYPGYEGYYNYYNIGASGNSNEAVLRNGLAYARNKGWDTRFKSLDEGAAFIGKNYILQGQDTLYLQKFDIESPGALHQYMQNIMAPYTEGRSMQTMYKNAGSLNSDFVFKIPVYLNMPGPDYTMTPTKLTLEKGKTHTLTVKCNNVTVAGESLIFQSDDETVAVVSEGGVITAIGSGTTTIRVFAGSDEEQVEMTCTITVYSPLQAITLNHETIELFAIEGTPESIPVLNQEGKTEYKTIEECPTEMLLEVSYDPIDTTDNRDVTWTVEAPEVASIIPDETAINKATVLAKSGGTTVVTAKVGNCEAEVEITVRVPMTEAKLNQDNITLYQGQTETITVSYSPYNTTDVVEPEWYSNNEQVAVVENGAVKALAAGTTDLHARIGAYDGTQVELTCTVTVQAYEVTFMGENQEVLMTVPGTYGKPLYTLHSDEGEIPWEQEKENAFLAGWYTGENGTGDEVTPNTILYGDMTLYPYFISEEEEFYVKPIGSVTYTGGYIKPEVEVYDQGRLLTKGKDYTVRYVNNKAVNDSSDLEKQPAVIVTGKGSYAVETTEYFTIAPKDISHIDVTANNMLTSYNGRVQKLQPVIQDAERTLQKNKDYTLEYWESGENAYREAGTYGVRITGTGNYTGSRTVYITITKRTLISEAKLADIGKVYYNGGNSCYPEILLSYQGKTLTENKDYTLSWWDNTEVGIAGVMITGQGDFIGNRVETFRILGNDFTTVKINGITDKEYTGGEIKQSSIVVKDRSGRELTENTDYKVSYQNNIETGRATVTLTGMKGYTGTVTKTFKILPYDIAVNSQDYTQSSSGGGEIRKPAFEMEDQQLEIEYDKNGAKPDITVTFKGQVLTEGKDYKLTYKNNYSAAKADGDKAPTVTITGKGNFTGTVSRTFTITSKDLGQVSMTARDVRFRNKQGFCFVDPVLKEKNGRVLTAGTDYDFTLTYTYMTDVVLQDGTTRLAGETVQETDIPTPGELEDAEIKVTARGIGNYEGEISCTYRILENSATWIGEIFGEKEAGLKVDGDVIFRDTLYPENEDSIKLGVEAGALLKDKANITFSDASLRDLITFTPEISGGYTKKKLEEQKEAMNSYEETQNRNVFDRKVIAANKVDFSDVKIIFLGDSITEGVGIQIWHSEVQIIFLTPLSTITSEWYKKSLPNMLPVLRYVNAMEAIGP